MAGNPNWTKGTSGNPGGRPKIVAKVRDLARQHTDVTVRGDMERQLVNLIKSLDERAKPEQSGAELAQPMAASEPGETTH
jgi:hypothetical protein